MPVAGGAARRPIAVVRLNGAELNGVLSVKTTNVSHNAADTFQVELALSAQPKNVADWAAWGGDNTNPEIEVLYGLVDANGNRSALNSAVLGPVDSVEVRQPENIVSLSGRDYSAALLDTQTYENFTNQTASQIATTVAQRHGLTPVVQATKTRVGAKDADTNATTRNTRRESEWDLLTKLARDEGFVVYVRGRTLYFLPDTDPSGTPYLLTWSPPQSAGGSPRSNMIKLNVKRALTLAKTITVTVISHDPATATAVSQSATSPGAPANGDAQTVPQLYTIDVPGLTADQAMVRAHQLLNSYSLFERVIEVHLPGDPFLWFEQPVKLSGTGTSWDQTYFADRIEREMSMGGGFTMVIRAKNHSTTQNAGSIPQGNG